MADLLRSVLGSKEIPRFADVLSEMRQNNNQEVVLTGEQVKKNMRDKFKRLEAKEVEMHEVT